MGGKHSVQQSGIRASAPRSRQLKTQRRAANFLHGRGTGVCGAARRGPSRDKGSQLHQQGLPTMARRLLFLHALVASNAEFKRRSGTGDCVKVTRLGGCALARLERRADLARRAVSWSSAKGQIPKMANELLGGFFI